jgi:hypothetical protein
VVAGRPKSMVPPPVGATIPFGTTKKLCEQRAVAEHDRPLELLRLRHKRVYSRMAMQRFESVGAWARGRVFVASQNVGTNCVPRAPERPQRIAAAACREIGENATTIGLAK